MLDKASLRKTLRQRRASLPCSYRRGAEQRVASRLHRLGLFKRGRRLGIYLALGSELALGAVLIRARRFGARPYTPLIPRQGRKMRFADLAHPRGVWHRNRFGIAEYRTRPTLAPRALHAVLVPLLGFDAACQRMGQGGGYYDTTFAFRRKAAGWRKPQLIGVAFDCQRVTTLPVEAHDVVLDMVVTERTIYRRGITSAAGIPCLPVGS